MRTLFLDTDNPGKAEQILGQTRRAHQRHGRRRHPHENLEDLGGPLTIDDAEVGYEAQL